MNHRQEIGRRGEEMAKQYLIGRGYKILAQNVKLSFNELDIVAEKDGILVFVEVKTRSNDAYGRADEAMLSRKTKRIKRGISQYLRIYKPRYRDLRLDFIAIDLDKDKANISHFEDVG